MIPVRGNTADSGRGHGPRGLTSPGLIGNKEEMNSPL